ncbi:MAG: Arc family DNA-binding protein [Acidaminococcaceae bacterium]|nr:Arc family DNA-binding protein [Acidaminococcaceae bacterium]
MESRTSIKLPNELKELIKKEAKKQHRSIHNMIITILWEYFSEK